MKKCDDIDEILNLRFAWFMEFMFNQIAGAI